MERLPDKLWYLILTILIILITTFLVWQNFEKRKILAQLNSKTEDLLYSKETELGAARALQDIIEMQWWLEGKKINKNLVIKNIHNQKIAYDSLVKSIDGKLIILRFGWNSCEDCQIQEIKFLQQVNDYHNIIIIASFKTFRDFRLYMQTYNVTLPVYYLEPDKQFFENQQKSINNVFCFITDISNNISTVHVGSVSFPELSEIYYKMITNR